MNQGYSDHNYLRLALEEREIEATPRRLRLRHVSIGDLVLPTGRLVACDPFSGDGWAFAHKFPSGSHPVILSIAELGTDERNAFATIRFAPEEPVSWSLLTCPGEDIAELGPGEIFGYSVDSGTGAFMDEVTLEALSLREEDDDSFADFIVAELQKTYRDTRSWASIRPDEAAPGNLLCFTSGWGDGTYPCYAGKTAAGKISVVVTDLAAFNLPK